MSAVGQAAPTSATRSVPIIALAPGVKALRTELDAAVARVLDRGLFLLGPETEAFERAFAAYHGQPSLPAIGVGTGTDALWIGLKALGIRPGDEVLVTANAGIPPVAAVVASGAVPVFCDVDPASHTLDPQEIARKATPRTRAVLVVHLYGRAADMAAILPEARERGLAVLEDCAQAHGARTADGSLVGTLGDAAAFSFYPTKNLGALGDGGAILARDAAVAERARMLRMYGWPPGTKYRSELHSTVTRLDEIQAAVLAAKLPHLDDMNAARGRIADRYRERLAGLDWLTLPEAGAGRHVYHLFVARVPAARRDALRAHLAERGVGTDVHYPEPAHLQAPYADHGGGQGSLPHTEQIARDVISLPMYPELTDDDVAYVAEQVRSFPI